MLAIARHLRVVGMPGEEKEVVQVENKVEKESEGKVIKDSEIGEKEEGEVEEEDEEEGHVREDVEECNLLFKAEEVGFDEVSVYKHIDQGGREMKPTYENNPLSEKYQIPRLPCTKNVHRLSRMSRRRSRKENGPGPLSAAERQRNWALRMLKDPKTREAFMQRRREYQQRYRDRLSKEGWEEVKKRQRDKKKEKYVSKKVQKMLENRI